MRTTLTLDDDVARQLEHLRAERRRPYRELVNEVLRTGLARMGKEKRHPQGPFTRGVSLGQPRLPDLDDVSEALAIAEGEDHQ